MKATTGELDDRQIESLLHEETVARIAYVDRRGSPYIVPVTYAYDGESFFGYSPDGSKLEGMRHEPHVCVEVDRVRDAADWQSVVAFGRFEELRGDAAVDAVRRISERLTTLARAFVLPDAARRSYVARLGAPGIAYRIRIERKSGRFARSECGSAPVI
jgi:nitroimidazol reductase NimA-like FMN-containing flavoprotein (pyridoxamine 5'-phosphate oxidase superfamily)